jgi:hypothetical protein
VLSILDRQLLELLPWHLKSGVVCEVLWQSAVLANPLRAARLERLLTLSASEK